MNLETEKNIQSEEQQIYAEDMSSTNSAYKIIENTPFGMVKEENSTWITIGKYKIEECKNEEEAIENANVITWDKICTVIEIINEYNREKNGN